jgi:hypothetical protein
MKLLRASAETAVILAFVACSTEPSPEQKRAAAEAGRVNAEILSVVSNYVPICFSSAHPTKKPNTLSDFLTELERHKGIWKIWHEKISVSGGRSATYVVGSQYQPFMSLDFVGKSEGHLFLAMAHVGSESVRLASCK